MKIEVDQEGAKHIELIADLALKSGGIKALQLVNVVISNAKLDENTKKAELKNGVSKND